MTEPHNLPEGTYGVECEFHTGSKRYTYFVNPSQGEIEAGDYVVVASPGGGYKVIYVCGRVRDLTNLKVSLQYMKYIVMKVRSHLYNALMADLSKLSEGSSPLIDDTDSHDNHFDFQREGKDENEKWQLYRRHGDDPGSSG